MTFEYDNDRDFISALDYAIDNIVEEISPLTGNHDKWEYSKKTANKIWDEIFKLVNDIKESASVDIDSLQNQVIKLELENEELNTRIEDLQSRIADLTMKLEQPGKWYGNKFGL
jgi:SMC interacting uncharacterized protein involved in chromosome segregation